MILAAGKGTRLKPLTDEKPKALIPVGGTPMLEHVILRIKEAGFTHIVINIHHFGEQIIDFLKANNNFGVVIDISDERGYLLDTGGGIKQASRFLTGNEPFLVHNVDIFSDVDLKAMYQSHINSKAPATLLVDNRSGSRKLLFGKDEQLHGWRNRETGEIKSFVPNFDPSKYMEYTFGGVHVISPEIIQLMDEWTGKFSVIDFYLSICLKKSIRLYTENELCMIDIGKMKGLEEATQLIKHRK
jgi:Nucleoside-diphosphate-sugar pyrophosphorylase involved in lipopolysaccharide biosynthesis/translation initiation factor 2B, gamma/epsilon subunits (eIF-2Bgamma/eIF-2Bepsilon)